MSLETDLADAKTKMEKALGQLQHEFKAIRTGRATTAIVDHHESPSCIEGSLSIIANACAEVGVRTNLAYGVTDRHGADGAQRGLAENERFLRTGGRGMVGVHAAFTAPTTPWLPLPAWQPTWAWACTFTSLKALTTWKRGSGWRRSPATTGGWFTACTSTAICRAPSPTTRAAT